MHHLISIISNASSKPNIRRAVKKYRISRCSKRSQRRNYASENSIFISNTFFRQSGNSVSLHLPVNDRLKIFFSRRKIPVCRMLRTSDDRLRDRRYCWEIHICYPHRDHIKTVLWFGWTWTAASQSVYCNRIHIMSVYDRCKIVFHSLLSS